MQIHICSSIPNQTMKKFVLHFLMFISQTVEKGSIRLFKKKIKRKKSCAYWCIWGCFLIETHISGTSECPHIPFSSIQINKTKQQIWNIFSTWFNLKWNVQCSRSICVFLVREREERTNKQNSYCKNAVKLWKATVMWNWIKSLLCTNFSESYSSLGTTCVSDA